METIGEFFLELIGDMLEEIVGTIIEDAISNRKSAKAQKNAGIPAESAKSVEPLQSAGVWQCECGYVESEHFKTCACCGRRRAEPVQLKKVV